MELELSCIKQNTPLFSHAFDIADLETSPFIVNNRDVVLEGGLSQLADLPELLMLVLSTSFIHWEKWDQFAIFAT